MLGELTPLEQTRAYREIVEKNQPIWFAEGHEEGHQEGRQREAQLILRQLHRRLGALTEAQQASVKALPVEKLEDLGEALLDSLVPMLQRGNAYRATHVLPTSSKLCDPRSPSPLE